ncbi:MAG: hypothetical protein ACI8WA_000013 [Polaribacter sp.]|jgi:hypothetical protein
MLNQIKETLEGKVFIYQEAAHLPKRELVCESVESKGDKIIISTNARTFAIYPFDAEDFLSKCKVLEKSSHEVVIHKPSQKDVYQVAEYCEDVSISLKSMFDKIVSGKASDKEIQGSKAAISVAGKIIDIEKIKLGYLILNHK